MVYVCGNHGNEICSRGRKKDGRREHGPKSLCEKVVERRNVKGCRELSAFAPWREHLPNKARIFARTARTNTERLRAECDFSGGGTGGQRAVQERCVMIRRKDAKERQEGEPQRPQRSAEDLSGRSRLRTSVVNVLEYLMQSVGTIRLMAWSTPSTRRQQPRQQGVNNPVNKAVNKMPGAVHNVSTQRLKEEYRISNIEQGTRNSEGKGGKRNIERLVRV